MAQRRRGGRGGVPVPVRAVPVLARLVVAVAVVAAGARRVDAYLWTVISTGDCSGSDLATTYGSPTPVVAQCGAGNVGMAAVCWDAATYTNPLMAPGTRACTYKAVTPAACTGGSNTGIMWECHDESVGPVADGLKAYYAFNGNLDDWSGAGWNGVMHGTVYSGLDRAGNYSALELTGAGYMEIVHAPAYAAMEATGLVTVAAWVRPEASPFTLLTTATATGAWHVTVGPGGVTAAMGTTGSYSCTAAAAPLSVWSHVAVVNGGAAQTAVVYINGARACSLTGAATAMTPSSVSLAMGLTPPGSPQYSLGVVDELRIYNRTLADAEVAALAAYPFVASPTPSVTPSTAATPSALPSPSPSPTRATSPSPSPSSSGASPIATATRTPSVTRTPSLSASRPPSPSATASRTATPTHTPAPPCPGAGLVARYATDGTLADTSSGGNTAVMHGIVAAAAGPPGRPGAALAFDGTCYMEIPHTAAYSAMEASDTTTIAAWIYPTAWSVTGSPVFTVLESAQFTWMVMATASGTSVIMHVFGDYAASVPLPLRTWTHIAVVNEGASARGTIYYNGSVVYSAVPVGTGIGATSSPLYVGYGPSGGAEYSHGSIYDLRVYNRALGGAEVAALTSCTVTNTAITAPPTPTPTLFPPSTAPTPGVAARIDPNMPVSGTVAPGASHLYALTNWVPLSGADTIAITLTAVTGDPNMRVGDAAPVGGTLSAFTTAATPGSDTITLSPGVPPYPPYGSTTYIEVRQHGLTTTLLPAPAPVPLRPHMQSTTPPAAGLHGNVMHLQSDRALSKRWVQQPGWRRRQQRRQHQHAFRGDWGGGGLGCAHYLQRAAGTLLTTPFQDDGR